MKKAVAVVAVAACLMIVPIVAHAAEETTLKGELVDINCYLGGKSGEAHAACARACATKGNPIGLVVGHGDEAQMYLVLGASGKQAKDLCADQMGKQVAVTGTVSEKNGMKVIAASKVGA